MLVSSCKKNDCDESLIPFKNLESDYGCTNTKYTLVIDLDDSVKIIRSAAAYNSEVTGSCHPEIDFEKYDLIIGKQSSGKENDTIIYDYRSACPGNIKTLTVDIVSSAATIPDNVVYHAIIPKLGDEEKLQVYIKLK